MKKRIIIAGLILLLIVAVIGRRRQKIDNLPNHAENNNSAYSEENKSSGTELKVKSITTIIDKVGGRIDWSHANNLIAVSKRESDGYADLYTMEPDGSNQICLNCNKTDIPQKNNDQPAWDPSGQYIVFQSQDPNLEIPAPLKSIEEHLTQGGAGINNNLWLTTKDGSKFYQLTHIQSKEGVLHPHFSHSGKKLLWAERSFEGKSFGAKWMLKVADFKIDSDGTPRLENTKSYRPQGEDGTFYESHGFTLDDKEIIFSASIGRKYPLDMDIWRMNLENEKLTQLTNTENEWDEHAQLSPDGKKIVWISNHGYPWNASKGYQNLITDYWVMNLDGSGKERLTYFNEPGHDEYVGRGKKAICADSSWNKEGNKLIAVQSVGRNASRTIMIEF